MTSSMEEEEEEMGSLFEGMILFNPSQTPLNDHQQKQHPDPSLPPPSPLPPSSSSTSLPLDENLFSDLTLITPIDTQTSESQSHLSISTTTTDKVEPLSSISRQVSRKKKKAGIRIGYGRETSSLSDELSPSPSLSIPNSQTPSIIESPSPHFQHHTNSLASKPETPLDFNSELPSVTPIIESERQEKTNFEDIHVEILSSTPTIEAEILERSDFEDIKEEGGLILETADVGPEEDVGTSGSSTEEKLDKIRSQISEKLERVRGMATSVSAMRKELARKRRKAVESVNLASLKYRELEKELEEACEAEDFEKAERLSENLAAAEKEKEGFVNALRDAEVSCDSVELKMQEVLELQIAAEEEGVSLLEQFAKDAADNADLVLKNAEELSLKKMTEWLSSIEDLEVKKMEFEIESHLLKDARLGLNDSIEQVIEDDRREQEILSKKRDILTEELEKLRDLVRQKEAEIVENDSNIQVVEKKIAEAVSGFQEAQSSIDIKYYNMQLILSRMDSESEALSANKKEIDDFLSQEEKRGEKLKELANVSMDEAKACKELVVLRKSLALPILKYRDVKLRLAKTEAKFLEEVQILRQEVSAARALLQELSSARSNIQQEITSATQRIFFIDKRSPELEAEKRVAAAARNFKEAGRIAAEVKTLGVEKESIQTKMEADILHLGKIEEEINDTVKSLHEKEELILLKEKDAAMSGCERLRLVSATAMAERSAALELGDCEEANTLLAEAEAADSEATKLQQAYNLKEEEFEDIARHMISIELIANLGGRQLAEMTTSVSLSAV